MGKLTDELKKWLKTAKKEEIESELNALNNKEYPSLDELCKLCSDRCNDK
jgi:hypothetical protein